MTGFLVITFWIVGDYSDPIFSVQLFAWLANTWVYSVLYVTPCCLLGKYIWGNRSQNGTRRFFGARAAQYLWAAVFFAFEVLAIFTNVSIFGFVDNYVSGALDLSQQGFLPGYGRER